MASDSSIEGIALDPSKCSKLTVEEKRELVYELSKRSHGASEMLQTWSRQDILQILCAEMGKERKYTGLTKLKIIENLLKLVSEKKAGDHGATNDSETSASLSTAERTAKRQRKADNPSRLPVPTVDQVAQSSANDSNAVYCKNSACKAVLRHNDAFCKRCSCCICRRYDDNKDPSLWLVCSSEPPFVTESCGMSCHLECALKHEKAGIGKERKRSGRDGSFCCVSCGKVNDLLGCWRKQLMVAKDTRRVDILCYRVFLGQKLLKGAEKYQNLYEIVDEAVKKLETEVGPLTGLPFKMGRGIVNRLSSGPEVQKLCDSAVQLLDDMLSHTILPPLPSPAVTDLKLTDPSMVRFEDICATSLTVVLGHEEPYPGNYYSYTLWHRKAYEVDYPAKPTCTLRAPQTRFVVSGLIPATDYYFKVVCFNGTREVGTCEVRYSTNNCEDGVRTGLVVERSQSPATNCSSLSNPSSVEDETNNVMPYNDQNDDRADNFIAYRKGTDKSGSANLTNSTHCPISGEGGTRTDIVSLSDEERAMEICPVSHFDVTKVKNLQGRRNGEDVNVENGTDAPVQTGLECAVFVGTAEATLPITPFKTETLKEAQARNARSKSSLKDVENRIGLGEEPQDGSTSKKSGEERDKACTANGLSDRDFERCVKMIRWLECEGHIEKNFRQKFLTWYSLRATLQEVRIVKIFIDTFLEDPAALAEQLVDTFSETISSKRASVVPAGFCMKLWH